MKNWITVSLSAVMFVGVVAFFSANQTESFAGTGDAMGTPMTIHKVCTVMTSPSWRDSISVADEFAITSCEAYKTTAGATSYFIGCQSADAIWVGSVGGGLPNPNCGWK